MSLFDAFRYDTKRALVVGGATGMGAAVAELVKDAGAEVLNADRAPVTQEGVTALSVDLADRASIEALAAEVDGPIHALFSCAGVADGTPGIEKINFLGHRLLVELLLANGKLGRGSAIGMISSAAGMGWRTNLEKVQTYLGIADFEEASAWAKDNAKADYMWSKMAVNGYVAGEAMNLLKQGVRINAILPGPTDTPLAQANADTWLTFGADYREETGIAASTPLEQAYPLVFLCSDAAVGITGVTVFTDAGYHASGVTGAYDTAAAAVGFLEGEF